MDRIQEDVFDGEQVVVLSIQLSTSFGLPNPDPIGGAVAGATKATLFDKGLQKNRPIAVAVLPIIRQLSDDPAENPRRKVVTANP